MKELPGAGQVVFVLHEVDSVDDPVQTFPP